MFIPPVWNVHDKVVFAACLRVTFFLFLDVFVAAIKTTHTRIAGGRDAGAGQYGQWDYVLRSRLPATVLTLLQADLRRQPTR